MTGGGPPLPKMEDPVSLAAGSLLELDLAMAEDPIDTLVPESICTQSKGPSFLLLLKH